jgi:hypothetical protein
LRYDWSLAAAEVLKVYEETPTAAAAVAGRHPEPAASGGPEPPRAACCGCGRFGGA